MEMLPFALLIMYHKLEVQEPSPFYVYIRAHRLISYNEK